MSRFTFHTPETAPEASQPLLQNSIKAFGRIPGLHKVMAESPMDEIFQRYTWEKK